MSQVFATINPVNEVRVARRTSKAVARMIVVLAIAVLACMVAASFGFYEPAVSLILFVVVATIVAFAALAIVIAAKLPRPVPFAERSLLAARVASAGKALTATFVLAFGGYIGAVIATDLTSPTLDSLERVVIYFLSIATALMILCCWVVVLPIAILMGIGVVRAGEIARRRALRTAIREATLGDGEIEVLARTGLAWGALVGLTLMVPLLVAATFWVVQALLAP